MWRARTCRDVGKAIHPGPHTPERHPRHLIVAVAASAHGPTPQTRSRQAAPDDGSWEPREERGVPFVTGRLTHRPQTEVHFHPLCAGREVRANIAWGCTLLIHRRRASPLSPLPSPNAGGAFFRPESCAGRDLAVLAAALHKRRTGRLRVLEACCGSGMRGARYLAQVCAVARIVPRPHVRLLRVASQATCCYINVSSVAVLGAQLGPFLRLCCVRREAPTRCGATTEAQTSTLPLYTTYVRRLGCLVATTMRAGQMQPRRMSAPCSEWQRGRRKPRWRGWTG